MTPAVTIIAIVARDGAIGRGGDQPFHISADFKRFKSLTMGKPLIMGRRTFEALPGGALPGRRNIVVTRNSGWSAPGVERAASLDNALALCADASEIMVIGGGEVYRSAISLASRLEITLVDADVPDADTYFPHIDDAKWCVTQSSDPMTDPRSGAQYRFITYEICGCEKE